MQNADFGITSSQVASDKKGKGGHTIHGGGVGH